jgi:hypothetical protein
MDINPDLIGMSQIDSMHGDNFHAFLGLVQMMKELGYDNQFYDRNDGLSASAVFYKRDVLYLSAFRQCPFSNSDSEFLMLCYFNSR